MNDGSGEPREEPQATPRVPPGARNVGPLAIQRWTDTANTASDRHTRLNQSR